MFAIIFCAAMTALFGYLVINDASALRCLWGILAVISFGITMTAIRRVREGKGTTEM